MKKGRLSQVVMVRVSSKEHRQIKAAAQSYGITVSQYLRGSALAYAEPWEQEAALEKFAKASFVSVLAKIRAGAGLPMKGQAA